jgi:excisionase family DNA binding protein
MTQLINFDNYKVPRSTGKRATIASSCVDSLDDAQSVIEVDDAFRITLEILSKNNPNKTLFSLDEAAEQLTVGNEFIRRRIKSGKIKVTYLGDKPLISIVELARIITEGV